MAATASDTSHTHPQLSTTQEHAQTLPKPPRDTHKHAELHWSVLAPTAAVVQLAAHQAAVFYSFDDL